MTGAPVRTELPAAQATTAFRACLTALSRPGEIRSLVRGNARGDETRPMRSPGSRLGPRAGAAGPTAVELPVLALADLMVAVAAVDSYGDDDHALTAELARATGAQIAAPESARIALAGSDGPLGDAAAARVVEAVRRGTAFAPHEGALLILAVSGLSSEAGGSPGQAASGGAESWTLTGPGVDGSLRVTVEGLGAGFRAARARAVAGFPAGVDVLCVDPGGLVLGLPRTTAVEPIGAAAGTAIGAGPGEMPAVAPTTSPVAGTWTGREGRWATQE